MVRAWLFDETIKDQCKEIDIKALTKLGVFYEKLNPDIYAKGERYLEDPELKFYTTEREYNFNDGLNLSEKETKKDKCFSKEHFHVGDEICYVVEGSGYFDFRNHKDEWIRVLIEKGDLIGIPGGIYHRFNLDETNHIKYMRLCVGDKFFLAINRPADDHFTRKKYIKEYLF